MSEFNYWVASESRKRQADSGLRAGRISAQPGAVVPSGTTHAVNHRDEVACGRPLNGLLRFSDFSWESINSDSKCPRCRTAVATLTAGLGPSGDQVSPSTPPSPASMS
jgi:hypothetical protein